MAIQVTYECNSTIIFTPQCAYSHMHTQNIFIRTSNTTPVLLRADQSLTGNTYYFSKVLLYNAAWNP